jgi:plasmid maintenance system killer protein
MIQTFSCKDTEALYTTGKSRRFAAIAEVAARKLQMLLCFEWRDGHAWNVEIVDYH